MRQRECINKVVLYVVFTCYLFVLIKILLLSRISILELFDGQRIIVRSVNLIPFHSIMEYIFSSNNTIRSFAFGNVVGNIVIFIPLGIYLPLFKRNKRVSGNLTIIFLLSISVEVLQGLFGIGVSDIDDILLNSFGGWLGILGYHFILWTLRDEKKGHTAITILSALVGLPIIMYFLFMMNMRF